MGTIQRLFAAASCGSGERGHIPKVLPRVTEIDDLHRGGEVLIGQVPDRDGSVANDDLR
jgi:hypothetical protein